MSENDLIEVNEDENSLGYTASYSKSGDTNSNLTASTTGVTGTIKDNNVLITVTNTRNPITPTGIAMTFAPYALMVLFAGGIAVLFLRKKKEDF